MPQIITLGPLALSADRLLVLVFLGLFLLLSVLLRRLPADTPTVSGSTAILTGLIGARLIYVILNAGVYARDPFSILAVWQGGFHLTGGLITAMIFVLVGSRASFQGRLLAIGGCVLFAAYLYAQNALRAPSLPLPEALTFETISGEPRHLETLQGEAFVINLWASWCAPCRREMKMLAEVASGSRLTVLMINQGERPETVRRFLRREGISDQQVLLDKDASLSGVLGATALPLTLFVDSEGMIVKSHLGEISRAELGRHMQRLEGRRPGQHHPAIDQSSVGN